MLELYMYLRLRVVFFLQCNYLNVTNITNTAALVELNLADTTNQGRVIEYYQVAPSNDDAINQIGPTQTVSLCPLTELQVSMHRLCKIL